MIALWFENFLRDHGVISVYLIIMGGILKLLEKQKCSSNVCICLRAEISHVVTQCVGTALGSSGICRMQVWNNRCLWLLA